MPSPLPLPLEGLTVVAVEQAVAAPFATRQLADLGARVIKVERIDASSTAPHLRRARVFDEGGRGLLLVAQLTEHWGTRHNREGKVIWAEQILPASPADVSSAMA